MNGRIKAVRANSGLTQADFGAKIGVSQNYVWMMETGARVPGDRTIRDICREFGVNEVWLRTGAGEMFRPRSDAEELAELVDRIAKLPQEQRARVLIFGQGLVAAIELQEAKAAKAAEAKDDTGDAEE